MNKFNKYLKTFGRLISFLDHLYKFMEDLGLFSN